MKRYIKSVLLFFSVAFINSCGIINDTTEENVIYTFILKNRTGELLKITEGFTSEDTQEVPNGEDYYSTRNDSKSSGGALNNGYIRFEISSTGKGYVCEADLSEGICFIENQMRLFLIKNEDPIYTKTDEYTYEYVLGPELLEDPYDLP